MTIWQAILLGIIQGATEFLPISSSGHLVVFPALFGWEIAKEVTFIFDVWVQLGTLAAVIIYFWDDLMSIARVTITSLWRPSQWSQLEARLGLYLLVATIPAVAIGLLFQDAIEAAFHNPRATAGFLLLTAVLLLIAERVGQRDRRLEDLYWWEALWIGVFQALALFPGVSRSGATITGGMTRNLDRAAAARFSFLMAVPVMLGAGVFTGIEMLASPALSEYLPQIAVGMIVSAVVGYVSIDWLLKFLTSRPVYWFSGYLVLLAGLVFLVV